MFCVCVWVCVCACVSIIPRLFGVICLVFACLLFCAFRSQASLRVFACVCVQVHLTTSPTTSPHQTTSPTASTEPPNTTVRELPGGYATASGYTHATPPCTGVFNRCTNHDSASMGAALGTGPTQGFLLGRSMKKKAERSFFFGEQIHKV